MINKVILTGRLTKDPILSKTTGSGIPFVRFTLAVNRTFGSSNGEREADFVNCIVWRKQAENLVQYMKKGSLVGVDGRIQTGSYDDRETGKKVYTTDVVAESVQYLEGKKNNNSSYEPSPPPENNYENHYGDTNISDDDLPF